MVERSRLDSVDILRGAVMVLMALDHARDFFHDARIVPEDVADPGAALFLTRWVTHFCAPVFVFLAGTSVFLWRSRGRSAGEVSRYLLTRGLWLVVLEWTLVHFGWFFTFTAGWFIGQVILAIGAGMIVLAALVHLPQRAVLAVGIAIVAGHNLLDAGDCEVDPSDPMTFFGCEWWWILLHQEGPVQVLPWFNLWIKYPLLPWVGVMALGYGFGEIFLRPSDARRRSLIGAGAAMTLLFVLLRATSAYGDKVPWAEQTRGGAAWITFLNTEKYPPSLQFLLMTLGPSLLFLAFADRGAGAFGRVMATYGRVPLFFYLAHIYVLHAAADAMYLVRLGERPDALRGIFPEGYGGPLWGAWAAWLATAAALYLPCRWYGNVKRRNPSRLLTYL